MPRCEGLPSEPCPLKKNDTTVVIGKGDLMLCSSCDAERRRLFDETVKQKSNKGATRSGSTSKAADGSQHRNSSATTTATRTASVSSDRPASTSSDTAGTVAQAVADVFDDAVSRGSKVIINELLSYAQFYRDRSTVDSLHKLVVGFYSPSEIFEAKKLVIDEFSVELIDCPLKTARRHSTARTAHDAEAEDIIRMLESLDNQNNLGKVQFTASNFDKLPKYGPEEINLCAVVDKQVHLDTKVNEIASQMSTLTTAIESVRVNIASVTGTATVVAGTNTNAGRPSNVHTLSTVDRTRNVVITGIEESRDPSVWRDKVSEVLSTAAGRDVRIEDAFRLGKFDGQTTRTRPILVKLSLVWDRRLVLSGAHKLNSVVAFRRRVFINADEPLETRRRNIRDRLQKRAENRGQQVSLTTDGVLVIDGIEIFCLQRGFINRQVSAVNNDHNGQLYH